MRRILFLLLPLLTCFTPALQAKEDKRVIPYTRMARGQGMVMMRLITNHKMSATSPKWDKLDVHDLKTGKAYKLNDLYGGGHHGIFVASLPPGEYQADRVRVGDPVWQSLAEYGEVDFAPAGEWRFRVDAGRMTNLGSMLFLQLFAAPEPKPVYGAQETKLRYRWVHIPDENLPQRSAVLFHPDDYPSVLSKALGWTNIAASATLKSLPPEFRRVTLSLSGATPTVAGGTLFGEHFGQVAWRHADGKWTWEDTGTIESILFAADTPDGTRYAAAEDSILLQRLGPGDWRRIPVPLDDATPRMLYALGDGSLLTIWEQFEKSTALRYRPGADPAWTKEWELPSPGKVTPSFGCCNAVLSPRGIVYSTELYGFSLIIGKLAVWDSGADKWALSDPKFKGGPIGMFPDGALYSMTGGQSSQTFKVSSDRAVTWESRSVGTNLLRQPQFRTADEGYTIEVSPDISWTLAQTRDGGRSWHAVSTLPKSTHWFLVLPGQEVLIATEAGRLYSTPDNGKSWRLERDANAGT